MFLRADKEKGKDLNEIQRGFSREDSERVTPHETDTIGHMKAVRRCYLPNATLARFQPRGRIVPGTAENRGAV